MMVTFTESLSGYVQSSANLNLWQDKGFSE